MDFKYIHKGYYRATSYDGDEAYVVRTRPLNDGWMAIDEEEGLVISTGLTFEKAKQACEEVSKAKFEEVYD